MNTASAVNAEEIRKALEKTQLASRKLGQLKADEIGEILNELARLAWNKRSFILRENQKDLERMDPDNPKYDRLLLNEQRLQSICDDLRKVAGMSSPLGRILEDRQLDNGLQIKRVSVPLGVVGIVYESRPNVTFDVFALCLKSGNASVLKGSRDAHHSNLAIAGIIRQVLSAKGLDHACYLAPSAREALAHILRADQYIDMIIPRGGQGLIRYVRENARVPVIETGAGIVHTYFDQSGELQKGKAIIENAKARRVSVCNALDTLLIHRDRLSDLPALLERLDKKHRCTVYADEPALEQLSGQYSSDLLFPATEESYGTEFLSMKMSVKTVSDLDQALDHIDRYSSRHSEAIIAEDSKVLQDFLNRTDAAVVYANASTAFTDGGQFGMGAEIGISTQKLHARGPMALRELTSYKWVVHGDGQTRSR